MINGCNCIFICLILVVLMIYIYIYSKSSLKTQITPALIWHDLALKPITHLFYEISKNFIYMKDPT